MISFGNTLVAQDTRVLIFGLGIIFDGVLEAGSITESSIDKLLRSRSWQSVCSNASVPVRIRASSGMILIAIAREFTVARLFVPQQATQLPQRFRS